MEIIDCVSAILFVFVIKIGCAYKEQMNSFSSNTSSSSSQSDYYSVVNSSYHTANSSLDNSPKSNKEIQKNFFSWTSTPLEKGSMNFSMMSISNESDLFDLNKKLNRMNLEVSDTLENTTLSDLGQKFSHISLKNEINFANCGIIDKFDENIQQIANQIKQMKLEKPNSPKVTPHSKIDPTILELRDRYRKMYQRNVTTNKPKSCKHLRV